MTRRKRRLLLTSLAAVLAVVGGIVCLPPGTMRNGRADVRVTFAVVDADTGSPVPRAQILLRRSPDGFSHPPQAPGELLMKRAGRYFVPAVETCWFHCHRTIPPFSY